MYINLQKAYYLHMALFLSYLNHSDTNREYGQINDWIWRTYKPAWSESEILWQTAHKSINLDFKINLALDCFDKYFTQHKKHAQNNIFRQH